MSCAELHPNGHNVPDMASSKTACYRELGAELRKLRETREITARQVAAHTGWDPAKVSRIETGYAMISRVDVIFYAAACDLYGPAVKNLLKLSSLAASHEGHWLSPHGDWLEDSLSSLIFHESTATNLVLYDPMVVNGLLQTADYARALISRERWRDAENVERCVEIRTQRREIIDRPSPAWFTFYVHEQALRNVVGSDEVMHDQLLQVVLLAAMRNVRLRVVPSTRAEQGAFGGALQVMRFKQHPPLAYLDNRVSGLFLEDEDFIAPYRDQLLPLLAELAWDAGQSREFVATLANEFDRGSLKADGGIYRLEEEQL